MQWILVAVLGATTASTAVARGDEQDAARSIRRAKAAAAKGDHAAALAHFERALALETTAQVHFNIGVCHHALMLDAAADTPAHIEHRDAAIAAYRAYLDAASDAQDRGDVERIIAELSPPPVDTPAPRVDATPPGPPPALREAVTRIDPTPNPIDPPPEPPPDASAHPRAPPRVSSRSPARVGPFAPVVLAHAGRLRDSAFVPVQPMLGLGIRGGAFLGQRARVNLGAEFAVYGQPHDAQRRHRLVDAHLALTADYGVVFGPKRRFELAGGGLVGLLYESLTRRGAPALTCPTADSGLVAQRGALLIGPRLSLLLLLGKKRNHEFGLRLTPALAVTGNGDAGDPPDGVDECGQTPFAEAGLPGGAALVTTVDLGYAPRF